MSVFAYTRLVNTARIDAVHHHARETIRERVEVLDDIPSLPIDVSRPRRSRDLEPGSPRTAVLNSWVNGDFIVESSVTFCVGSETVAFADVIG